MHPAFIIQKKRDGLELKNDEIKYFIQGLSTGEVTDYQASAFLMATFFQGMNLHETVSLTQAMIESGIRYDLTSIPGPKIDKHSTGGVGDKVSLILAPLAAACGLVVPMMSGRGLGHSGGTLDKLESIPGFNVNLNLDQFIQILKTIRCAMIGQTDSIVPADKKLYALRDVTATVECIPLMVASILSKKIAEGSEGLVLDIKVGNGAFMKKLSEAKKLAKTLIQVSKKLQLKCRAVISNMDQPLGFAVGNSLEIFESICLLKGQKFDFFDVSSSDLKELTLQLCAHMLCLSKITKTMNEARKLALLKLNDKSAWNIFNQMVQLQGGDVTFIEEPLKWVQSKPSISYCAKKDGFISAIDTAAIGQILIRMGGGRQKTIDSIDHSVGFIFHKKLGTYVNSGDCIATIFCSEKAPFRLFEDQLDQSVVISRSRQRTPKLILTTFVE